MNNKKKKKWVKPLVEEIIEKTVLYDSFTCTKTAADIGVCNPPRNS
jgi:hypothetical protein